jgi:N-methylhydantoinase A/oxoprolinase/acetone carboxylase beta subunit
VSDGRQSLRAGVDIGGTFTDLVVYDDASGAFVGRENPDHAG